jgi:hypothetical protein
MTLITIIGRIATPQPVEAIISSRQARIVRMRRELLVTRLQNGQKRFLRNLNRAHRLHAFLAFFLFV